MDEKEELFMNTVSAFKKDEAAIAKNMEAYIAEIRRNAAQNPVEAKKDAKNALRRTGVTDKNGKLKKVIVSWE